ncbi:MAG: hypothetical protein ABI921_09760 [Panacibacter sp.]
MVAATAAYKIIAGIPLYSFTPSFHTSIQSLLHEAQYQDSLNTDYKISTPKYLLYKKGVVAAI